MRYSHRFFLYAPVALLATLAAAVAIHWFIASAALSKYLDSVNGHEIAPGVELHFAKKQMAGFPFRLDVIAEDFSVKFPGAHGPAEWRAEHFAMHTLDYGRVQAIFEAAGRQSLRWRDAQGKNQSLQFTPGLMRASAIDGDGRLSRFDFEMIAANAADWRAANVQFHLRRDPGSDALDVAFNADDVALGESFKSAFGKTISRIHLDAKLGPANALAGLLSGRSDWRKAAEDWRGHGGVLDIANFEIDWGKSGASGSGQLTLDAAHRPQGMLNTKIAGVQYIAQALEQRHSGNGIFSGLLNTLAQFPSDGAGRLPAPLAFKGGIAYVYQTPAGLLTPLY